jgi:choice-of-anchor B domain-containing protein
MKIKISLLFFLLMGLSSFGQTNYGMTSVGQLSYNQELSSLWGWRAPNGTEYALVGTTTGTSLVSLANPANPVQVQFIPGSNTMWREIKTFGNYCYVACDNCNEGLLIIDLSTLPNAVNYSYYKPRLTVNGDTDTLRSIHTLYVEDNHLYLAGTNISAGEPIIFNLVNPLAPQKVGNLPNTYAHDIFVRGDTIWSANIYDGDFTVYDITNKANPIYLSRQTTPNNFTHNLWISGDGNAIFSTDERANAFVASYDVNDMGNIVELDRWQTFETRGTGVIPHNAHVKNDYVVVSYYTDGVVILDGSRPSNLVEIARYDTYLQSNVGFFGCWGVYPYFPSGLIAASDINTGLHILQPNYQRACWLEGNVTDSVTGSPLSNVRVTISSTPVFEDSRLNGDYKTGYGIAGTYNVTYSKSGYYSKTLSVALQNGVLTIRDVELVPMIAFSFTGQVVDADNGNAAIANAKVQIVSANYNYSATTNASGNFTIPSMFNDNYSVYAGKWGYKTVLVNQGIAMNTPSPIIPLNRGYRDEFALDLGWTVSGNASTGAWERAVSEEILFNSQPATPDEDFVGDLGNQCYVTGANNAGSISADDVDNGNTLLRSPIFDLTTYVDPYVSFQAYFINVQGNGTPNDSMNIRISNGTNTAVLRFYNTTVYGWRAENFRISDFITPTANMRFEVETADRTPGHVVEAAFDYFEVVDSAAATTAIQPTLTESEGIVVYPNPFDKNFSIDINSEDFVDEQIQIFDLNGRLIHSQAINSIGIQNVELKKEMPAGFYILKIGKSALKLIKN